MSNNTQERKYGLFSLLALIVGVVIGSGIFVKNEDVIKAAGSATTALIAWVVMGAVIMLMVFAFVEIASSNKISGKPGTLSGWLTDFVNPKFGKAIGIFIAFIYFPTLLAMLPVWGAQTILGEIYNATGEAGPWANYAYVYLIAIGILLTVFMINIISNKASKNLGQTGLVLKTIPLYVIILGAIVLMAVAGPTTPIDEIVIDDTVGMFEGIMLALPAIMFTFDGFVYSASMQNEAKDHKTFMMAWVGGMAFVTIIYILYSVSIMVAVGNSGSEFTLSGAIHELWGAQTAAWLVPTMQVIVIISIISGLNGNIINGTKTFSSMSSENHILDAEGNMIKYNSQTYPQYAGYRIIGMAFAWIMFFMIIDAAYMGSNSHMLGTTDGPYAGMTGDWTTNFVAVLSFLTYTMVMIAGVWNRKTNKVEVERKWYFVPAAIISSTFLIIVAGYSLFDVFANLNEWYMILTLILIVGLYSLIYYISEKQLKKATPTQLKNKAKINEAFLRQEISIELENSNPLMVNSEQTIFESVWFHTKEHIENRKKDLQKIFKK